MDIRKCSYHIVTSYDSNSANANDIALSVIAYEETPESSGLCVENQSLQLLGHI